MATKILRVFQEFTSEGYVPMPPAGNIDYGVTIAGTFPSTTPATFQTDITDIEVEVTTVTDFYVWIRSHGSEWNYQYTRNVRVYPDSPNINNVVMGIIIANLGNTVPYTGATKNVNLGEFGIKAGHVGFDLTPTGIPTDVGTMVWNDQDGTLDLKLKGGNVTLQIGQEQVTRIVNKTGGDLLESNYQVVRISGAQGNRLKVALAQANNDANSAETLGIITETILNNQEGFITTSGLVRNINTTGSIQGETWVDGDMLYLSGTTAGRLTNIKPQAPTHTVIMGYVVRSHATQGQIYVKVDNGYELDELHNVKITSVAENNFLIYDATNSVWENRAVLKTNGYLPYFDSTEIFKQSPIFTDGTNVTINSLDVITGGGTANYIPKLGTTKTLVNSLLYDNGTNVGIGSTNPQFKFEVRGGAMGVYASTSYYGKQEISNNDYMFTSGSGFYFRTNDATATVFAGRINNSGNWGIGILNPTQKLDVNGNINIPTGSNYLINGVQLDTDDIPQGSTNQYLTEAGLYPYMYNFASGEIKWNVVTHNFYMNQASSTTNGWLSNTDWNTFNNKENAITAGTTAQYWRGDKSWQTLNTTAVVEGTNLYFTNARAIGSTLTGYVSGAGTITASDTILSAIQKLNGNVSALVTGVSSVFGRTGAVVATSGDYNTSQVTESGNLYYTDARARASLSFTAGSGAYNSTTGVITIPTNTNQLTNGAGFITGITSGMVTTALGYTPVPTTRTITINGTTQDLSADRTFTIAGTISGLTTNYIPKATSSSTLGNSLIFDNGTNIGIGITSPASALHIDRGNATASYLQFTAGTTTGQTASDGFDVGIDASGNAILNQQEALAMIFSTSGTEMMRINAGGNVSIGNTNNSFRLDVTGTGRFTGTLQVQGNINIWGGNASQAGFITANTANGGLYFGSSGTNQNIRFVPSGTGIVQSIGNFDVTGTGTFSSSVTAGGNISSSRAIVAQGTNDSWTGAGVFLDIAGGSSGRLGVYNYSTSAWMPLNINNGSIYSAGSNGNVGIGITSPATRLHILASAESEARVQESTNNAWVSLYQQASISYIIAGRTGGTPTQPLVILTGGSERMRITSTGIVNIGSTSLNAHRLSVLNASTQQLGLHYDTNNYGSLGARSNGDFQIYSYTTGVGYKNILLGVDGSSVGGNVGIGTTSPAYRLDIAGDLNISTGSVFRIGGTAVSLFTGSGTTNYLTKFTGSTALGNSSIFDNGNVGIATASPSAQLHVASGNFVLGNNPSFQYKFNVQGISGNYISFWTPTISGSNNNGLLSHNGGGLGSQTPMGYYASTHVFNGEVTGGGALQVSGDVNISGTFRVNGTAIGTGGGGVSGSGTTNIHAKWSGSTSLTNAIVEDDGSANVYINGASVANASALNFRIGGTNRGLISFVGNEMSITNLSSSPIRFLTNNTERMRIASDGRLLINDTSFLTGNAYLQVTQGSGIDPAVTIKSGAVLISFFNSSNSTVGSITHNGTNTAYNTSSDYRLKTDLRSFNGLQLLDKINVYDFAWKVDNSRMFGVMAHELQEVLPYAVTGIKDGNGMQGVDYSKIVPILVQSIKELKAEIATLKDNV